MALDFDAAKFKAMDLDQMAAMDPEELAAKLYGGTGVGQDFFPEIEFKLNQVERGSKVWLKVDKYLQDMVKILRESNDDPHSELETAKIRGKIELVKEIRQIGMDPVGEAPPDSPDLGY